MPITSSLDADDTPAAQPADKQEAAFDTNMAAPVKAEAAIAAAPVKREPMSATEPPRKSKAERRQARAKARRRAALERAAPNSLNPYASDDSDAGEPDNNATNGAAAEAEDSEAKQASDELPADEEAKELNDEEWAKQVQAGRVTKGEKLAPVDHSAIDYPAFRKVIVFFSFPVWYFGECCCV